jgi:hypothetical protein
LKWLKDISTTLALDEKDEIIGYEFIHLGKMMEAVKKGTDANEALKKATSTYGRFAEAKKTIDPLNEEEEKAALFESYDRRIKKIDAALAAYGIKGLDDAKAICDAKGLDVAALVKGIQPIAFENACGHTSRVLRSPSRKGCTGATGSG